MNDYEVAPLPDDAWLRQLTVDEMGLDAERRDESLDRVIRLLAAYTRAPMAAFTVLDRNRQQLVARVGLAGSESERRTSFCSHTILQDEILEVADARLDRRFAGNPLVTGDPNIRYYAGIPVRAPDGRKLGALCAIDTEPRRIAEATRAVLQDLRMVLENELLLRSQSVRDHLTGLYNRRFFEESIEREWRRALREAIPVSLLIMDVDHFKSYNDRYGHLPGDHVLRQVARVISNTLRRGGDFVARFGGEEFVAILPQTDAPGALSAANAVREAVAGLRLEHLDAARGHVTLSIGISTAASVDSLNRGLAYHLDAADVALYAAKMQGRDRVSMARG